MNKTELVDAIAEKASLSKADSKKALDAFVEVVAESLEKEDKVTLIGLGTFSVVTRPGRTGRNPRTGEALQVPEKKVVKFKPGSELSSKVK
ncbi:MAG: HU family DNA-binding protein [Prevotellaceae bacterium]|jgi:DNA-binding protein HU-beta|nr:HU family DNA-binding protein [Prevotellaceae bacterium]